MNFYLQSILLGDSVFTAKESCSKTIDLDGRIMKIDAIEFQKNTEKMRSGEIDDCVWTITTSVNGSLKLTIREFRYEIQATEAPATTKKASFFDFFDWDSVEVEDVFGRKKRMLENPCDITFIEIFDGQNENFPRIGDKICGDSGSQVVTTTSNNAFVKLSFKTESSLDALKIDFSLASTLLFVINFVLMPVLEFCNKELYYS